MQPRRGRPKKIAGDEIPSSFRKTPALEQALLQLQLHYVKTQRRKPSMQTLLTEGIVALLDREGLPPMAEPAPALVPVVIEMPKKTGA
jgi:hypothetical protein